MRTVIRKRYTAEYRTQAVELVNLGRSVPEVAKELGIGQGMLYRWVRDDSPAVPLGSGEDSVVGAAAAADELRRLRRENANLKLENDILKKAAVILGTNPPSKGAC
jgi:transposase